MNKALAERPKAARVEVLAYGMGAAAQGARAANAIARAKAKLFDGRSAPWKLQISDLCPENSSGAICRETGIAKRTAQ